MADKELNELNLELEDLKDLDLADASEISVVEELEREIVDEDLSSDNGEDRKLINDGVYLYLKEIGKIPALAPGEELTLASLIEQGGAVGEKAKRKLVQANLRLVISVAKRYAKDAWTLLDLIQEGNLGLMRAADKFDRVKGYKFSTCAIWWIRQAISRSFADKSRSIRIPAHMIEQASKLRKAKLELTQVLGRIPTEFELAAVLEINIEKLKRDT